MRKRSAYRPRGVNPAAHLVAMQGACRLSLDDRTVWALQLAGAIDAVRRAQAAEADWSCIFDCVNLVEEFVLMRLARDDGGVVERAQEACVAILDRQRATGTRAARAAELQALAALQEAWIFLLENVTHAERFAAGERVARRVRAALAGHAPQGARVIEPPRAAA